MSPYIKNKDPLSLSCKNQVTGARSPFNLCEELKYLREPEHQYNKHVVSVYSKKTNKRIKFIRHIPGTMAKLVHVLMSKWKRLAKWMLQMEHGYHLVLIEIFYFYFLYGVKVHKSSAWEKIKQCERDLILVLILPLPLK